MSGDISSSGLEEGSTPPHSELRFCASLMSEEIAHELASPLRFLEMVIEGVRGGAPLDPEELSLAMAEIARLRGLVSALRSVKPPKLAAETVPLAALVEEARSDRARRREWTSVRWSMDLDPDALVAGDRAVLEFIVEAMLEAALGEPMEGSELRVEVTASPREISLEVRGTGRAASAAPLVPWNTEHPSILPLSIARRMARAHQFRLTAESAGSGATLRLTVPATARGE